MSLEIVTVPCLEDNYAFLLHDELSGMTALTDVPEAKPILDALAARGWKLSEIWITHHHWDHIDGLDEVRAATGAQVTGARADAHRLPPLDRQVEDGSHFDFSGHDVRVLDVSGHTVGHVAYYVPDVPAVFTGDSLMALGCGRVFEGTPAQMWQSLCKLAALPPDTIVCSGHEYSLGNARFALTIEPGNEALRDRADTIALRRAKGESTVPTLLSEELATNPFLRAAEPSVKALLGMEDAADEAVFAEIRGRKDRF